MRDWKQEYETQRARADMAERERDAARAELERLTERLAEALRWYADAAHYEPYRDHAPDCHPEGGCVNACGEHHAHVDGDRGKLAREALANAGPDASELREQVDVAREYDVAGTIVAALERRTARRTASEGNDR